METFNRLTAKMALDLAAPHTWPAAIMPSLVALCCAAAFCPVSWTLSLVMLAIVVLMQSAVNTFNDYYDYVKGTDDPTAAVDADDAVLVYNHVNPRHALGLAIGFLIAAFLLGIYPVLVAGWVPLVIALIGALAVVLYSAGSSPISYLPLGEAVSGLVMGGLIPLAYFYVLTGSFDLRMLIWALPQIMGIALIMFTNNLSDIERDKQAKRRTLAAILGRKRSVGLYRAATIVWLIIIVFNVLIWFRPGTLLLPFLLLCAYPLVRAIFKNPFTPKLRRTSMAQILSLNIALGALYSACILCTSGLTCIL